jgi:hypothetical protein
MLAQRKSAESLLSALGLADIRERERKKTLHANFS